MTISIPGICVRMNDFSGKKLIMYVMGLLWPEKSCPVNGR